MPITCIGLSHRTAPVEVRERHAFPPSRMAEALVALRDYEAVREAVMLQTCGRLEIYASLDDYENGVAQIKSFLANFRHGTTGYDIESYLYTLLGRQAVEHLFRVCTGLDSMLIGEAEILGQVKDAYVAATRAKSLGRTLHRLFREAIAAGKTARAQTRIGGESVSIATAAVEAARARLGTLEGTSILVVGAGKMGRAAVKRLRQEGAQRVIVVNRTLSRSRELVGEAGFGEAVEMPELAAALADGRRRRCLDRFVRFRARRSVGAPRDGSAARSGRSSSSTSRCRATSIRPSPRFPTLRWSTSTGSSRSSNERLELRREAIPAVEEIIAEYVERFENWYHSRVAVPVIARLTQKAEAIRVAELERLFARCPESRRARAHARDRHDDDDRLEAAALGDLEDARKSNAAITPKRSQRARARRSLRLDIADGQLAVTVLHPERLQRA